jgi:hypothetical protein
MVNHIPALLGIRHDQPRESASSGFGIKPPKNEPAGSGEQFAVYGIL